MRKILIVILLFSSLSLYAQQSGDADKNKIKPGKYGKLSEEEGDSIMASPLINYDKFKNVSTVKMKFNLSLEADKKSKTYNADMNLMRTVNNNDTTFIIQIFASNKIGSYCGKGDEIIFLINESNTYSFKSYDGYFNSQNNYWDYGLFFEIPFDFIQTFFYSSKVEFKCYLKETQISAKLTDDNLKIFKLFLKNNIFTNE